MSTVRKSITFTSQMNEWIKSMVDSGKFTNESDYIRDLIRRDQAELEGLTELKAAIQEGFESGVSDLKIPDIMQNVEKNMRSDGRL